MKGLFSGALVLALLMSGSSCKNEKNLPETNPVDSLKTGAEVMAELEAQSFEEDDIEGRIKNSISKAQAEFTKSEVEEKMPGLKNVKLVVDADCNLTITNEDGEGSMTKLNLADLDAKTGFSLIADMAPGEFPGLRIKTIDEKAAVEIYQGGKLVNKDNELVIFLATRQHVERITPIMLQSIQICQGTIIGE